MSYPHIHSKNSVPFNTLTPRSETKSILLRCQTILLVPLVPFPRLKCWLYFPLCVVKIDMEKHLIVLDEEHEVSSQHLHNIS